MSDSPFAVPAPDQDAESLYLARVRAQIAGRASRIVSDLLDIRAELKDAFAPAYIRHEVGLAIQFAREVEEWALEEGEDE